MLAWPLHNIADFNFEGCKAVYCKKHAEDDMVKVAASGVYTTLHENAEL